MIINPEEVLCFYVQDMINVARNVKTKLNLIYSQNTKYYLKFQCSPERASEIFNSKIEELSFDIMEILDHVSSLPLVWSARKFVVTGATNDQVYIADWSFLKETFEGYMKKISKCLKNYYGNIIKFYDTSGNIDESLIIKVGKKEYTYNDINNFFTLAVNYLYDISPLIYYDKFRDTLL